MTPFPSQQASSSSRRPTPVPTAEGAMTARSTSTSTAMISSNTNVVPIPREMRDHLAEGLTRRRNAGAKVRTGCITCKVRRVKCDEGKPACRRCINFGVECDGYPPVKPRRGKTKPTAVYPSPDQPLLPKPASPASAGETGSGSPSEIETQAHISRAIIQKQRRSPFNQPGPPTLTILIAPRETNFANEQEYRYFRVFYDRTAHSLAGYVNDSLWDRMVLQACEQSEMVRHAVIAIGAVDRCLDSLPCRKFLTTARIEESAKHHQFALKEYGKAIRQMSEALASGKKDIRTALIVCLLTICFESFDGDIPMATTQIRNGLALIKEWREGLVDSTLFQPKPETPDRELVHMFERLENHSSMIMDVKQLEHHDPRVEEILAAGDQIPSRFETVVEASMYFESIMNCTLHWVGAAYAWGDGDIEELKHRSSPNKSAATKIARAEKRRTFEEQHEAYVRGFRYWFRAFERLLKASREPSHPDYVACTALHLRYKACYTTLAANFFDGELCYDNYVDEFREVVDMAETLIQFHEAKDDRGRAKFTFDGPILSSLWIVAMKCRDPTVRRKAIALSASRPRRECILDNTIITKIAVIQMQIEEAGRVDDHIPEHARIRGIKTTYNALDRTGRMKFLRMIPGWDGKFVKQHVDFSWDNVYGSHDFVL